MLICKAVTHKHPKNLLIIFRLHKEKHQGSSV